MRMKWSIWLQAVTAAGLLAGASGSAAAVLLYDQAGQSQPPPQQGDKSKTPDVTPLTLAAPAPVNAEEDAAYTAFQAVNQNDSAMQIELGEAFLQKYPESRYKSPVYGALTMRTCRLGTRRRC